MKRSISEDVEGSVRKKACVESMLVIRPSDVPAYLHDSEFYRSLNLDDNDELHVPSNFMKANTSIESVKDVADLLHTIRYWGVNISAYSVVPFCLTQEFDTLEPILSAFQNEFPFIENLLFSLNDRNDHVERMEAAMESGLIDVVRHFKHQNENTVRIYSMRGIAKAASGGHIACLKSALKQTERWNLYSSFFHNNQCTNYDVYYGAVINGHLDCVKLLLKSKIRPYSPNVDENIVRIAVEYGQLECLKYIMKKSHAYNYATGACEAAAKGGHFKCLKYLHKQHVPWTKEVCVAAASSHSITCLKYAHKHGCKMSKNVCLTAARVGSLDCLRYYIDNGKLWHPLTCHTAALNGHLSCLEYAHTHGSPLNLSASCEHNRAYKKHFRFTKGPAHLVHAVAKRHHWDCVEYLILHDYPLTQHYYPLRFANNGDLEGLVCALKHGCTPSVQVLIAAARHGHLECMIAAHEHGCPWSEDVCEAAACGGHLHCLQYAREHGCPWNAVEVRRVAADRGYVHVVEYVGLNNTPVI